MKSSQKLIAFCILSITIFSLIPNTVLAQSKPAYWISSLTFIDKEKYMSIYAPEITKVIAKYEGVFLVRGGGSIISLNDGDSADRINVIKFPSIQKAKEMINSEEFKKARMLAKPFFKSTSFIADGLEVK